LDYFNKFLINTSIYLTLELLAATAGTYYLKKNTEASNSTFYLVYFLWFTFILEVIAIYSPIAYFTDCEYFGFVYDTVFERNIWLYNIYSLISFSFFVYYIMSLLKSKAQKKTITLILYIYLIIGVLNLILSDVFFKEDSVFTAIAGTLLLLLVNVLFYFDLLKSNQILNLKKQLPIYISVGVLVFYLCVTPIDLFSQYFKRVNELFVNVKAIIYIIANIFMYTTFTIGFLVCAKKNNSNIELNE
jgi:hypothetical protein